MDHIPLLVLEPWLAYEALGRPHVGPAKDLKKYIVLVVDVLVYPKLNIRVFLFGLIWRDPRSLFTRGSRQFAELRSAPLQQ